MCTGNCGFATDQRGSRYLVRMPRPLVAASFAIVTAGLLVGCASFRGQASSASPPSGCPAPPDSTGPARLATVFVDGRPIATNVRARLERQFPESYELEPPEPPALTAIPIESIDLIQFASGQAAERDYQLCPGVVAFLITLKRSAGTPSGPRGPCVGCSLRATW